jgi:hypothetical protein
MPTETVANANGKRHRNKHGPKVRYDRRRKIGQRVAELVALFRLRLGADADDPITAAAIARCAETIVLSEHLRSRMLRGENVSPDDVLRASRTADLLTRKLGLDRRSKPPAAPTLSEYLQSQREAGT